jgi:chromate transporter
MRPVQTTATPGQATSNGSVVEVLLASLRLGLTSFGGPVAHIGYFRREYVERRRWLDEATFGDLVALCQALPGPASSQLGIAIGTLRAGPVGGLAAWLGFTTPSAVALVAFALLTGPVDVSQAGWVHGLKVATVAVVAQAVFLMSLTLTPDWRRRALAAVAAAVVLAWSTPFAQVAVIAGGAAAGWLVVRPAAAVVVGVAHRSPITRQAGLGCLVLFVGLLAGLGLVRASGDDHVVAFVDAYYRAGSLVFGGGHVVLPLLHATVVDPGWVSDDRFLAGYGAAQAVPGPLFTFAAYLGAVSAGSPSGISGAALALAAIFLPSFLLVFGALPFWDLLRRSEGTRRALAGANAAVVGVLLAALVTPVWTSAIQGPADVIFAAAALAILLSGRVPVLVIVLGAAAAGQLVAAA